MLGEFLPLVVLGGVAIIIAASLVCLSGFFGPRKKVKEKLIPYECGVSPLGQPRNPFSVKYYLVALIFLIFDVEVMFFYPWALLFKRFIWLGPFLLFEMLFFVVFLGIAFIYIWKKDALEWK